MKLSFKIFCLTVYGHCLVLFYQDGVQNGCQIEIYMSDSMLQPFNYVVVKTCDF